MPAIKQVRAKRAGAESSGNGRGHDQYFSRAVSKALTTLRALQASTSPLGLNEVAQQIGLSKTSAFRLLRTLEAEGCITCDAWGRYSVAAEMQYVVPSQFLVRLLRVVMPLMRDLSTQLRETVSLAALFDNRIEAIAVVESPETIRMSNVIGHILPPNASSLGKVICAFQNEERREKLLRSFGMYRFTPHTITDRAELNREYERVQTQRYAADHEESVSDGCCFAVPIMGEDGQVGAAISISLPKSRFRGAEHEKILREALVDVADQIQRALGSA